MLTRRAVLKSLITLPLVPNCLAQTAYAQDNTPIEPFFIQKTKIWQGVDFKKGKSPFPFNLSERQIQRSIDLIVAAMHDPDMILPPVGQRSVESIGRNIVVKIDSIIRAQNLSKDNKFVREWLIAEGVCEWVRLNLAYDYELAADPGTGKYKYEDSLPSYIFNMKNPRAECWGVATTVRDIARAASLKCDLVNGCSYEIGKPRPDKVERNHSWVNFTLTGNIEVPADVVMIESKEALSKPKKQKLWSFYIMPRLSEAWEIYLATHFSNVLVGEMLSGDKQGVHTFSSITYAEWASKETGYLKPLLQQYESWERER